MDISWGSFFIGVGGRALKQLVVPWVNPNLQRGANGVS